MNPYLRLAKRLEIIERPQTRIRFQTRISVKGAIFARDVSKPPRVVRRYPANETGYTMALREIRANPHRAIRYVVREGATL